MEWEELYEKWGKVSEEVEEEMEWEPEKFSDFEEEPEEEAWEEIKEEPEEVTEIEEPKKKEIKEKPEVKEEQKKIQEMTIEIEKLGAKLEFFDNLRKTLEEKISHLSEQIGELRSMLVGREKFYGQVEIACKKMEGIIEMVKSEDVIKQLKIREKDASENRARIERIEKLIERFSEEMKDLRGVLERVRPLENIIGISKEIEEKIRIIEEKKNYVDRTAGKVEKIYMNLNEFVSDIGVLKSNIETAKNGIKDTVKLIDELRLNQENFITRTEMSELKKELGIGPAKETKKKVIFTIERP